MSRRNYRDDERDYGNHGGRHSGGRDDDDIPGYCSTFLQKLIVVITFGSSIVLNSLSNIGKFGEYGESVTSISRKYHSILTPPDFAFSIWILIYALWGIFVIFQMLGNSCLSNPTTFYSTSLKEGIKKNFIILKNNLSFKFYKIYLTRAHLFSNLIFIFK